MSISSEISAGIILFVEKINCEKRTIFQQINFIYFWWTCTTQLININILGSRRASSEILKGSFVFLLWEFRKSLARSRWSSIKISKGKEKYQTFWSNIYKEVHGSYDLKRFMLGTFVRASRRSKIFEWINFECS